MSNEGKLHADMLIDLQILFKEYILQNKTHIGFIVF